MMQIRTRRATGAGSRVALERAIWLVCVLLSGMGMACGEPSRATPQVELPHVRVATAHTMTFAQELRLPATVQAAQLADVQPDHPGRVVSVSVRIGDRVRAGETLLRLDTAGTTSLAREAGAASTQAAAQLDQAMAHLARVRQLDQAGVTTPADLEQAESAARIAAAAADRALASASGAQTLLAGGTVRAPFDGTVIARSAEVGELVGASPTPAVRIADLSRVRVLASVGELRAGLVAAGTAAELTVHALPGRRFPATLDRVNAALDPSTRSLEVQALIDNADGALVHGMAGDLTIRAEGPDTVAVPRRALLDRSGGAARVLVLVDGKALEREVRYGNSDQDEVPILEGLVAGDRVLVAGHTRLDHGAAVQVIEASASL